MTNLNILLNSVMPQYKVPANGNEAIGRVIALTAATAAGYFISDEETGIEVLDDYLFPVVKGALVGLTAAGTVLACDFFLNHHHVE